MAVIEQKGYKYIDQTTIGSKFLISNGYLGYRGTLDEADSSDLVALSLNGLYDGNIEYESVNAYNPIYTMLKADGINLNPKSFRPYKHMISLDTDTGLFKRQTDFKYGKIEITLKSERFADQKNKNLLYSKYSFKANKEIEVELYSGIDTFIWNINDIHLKKSKLEKAKGLTLISSKVKRTDIDICVGLIEEYNFDEKDLHPKKSVTKFQITCKAGKEYTIIKYAGVLHSDPNSKDLLAEMLQEAKKTGYKKLLKQNKEFWTKAYEFSKIKIYNNETIKTIADYSVYQMISHRPYSDHVSVPHKGLDGQFFHGGVSWKAEVLLMPFYINVDSESARHMVMYRVNGLPAAKLKAKKLGFDGALYPNISGLGGQELDPKGSSNMFHINGSIIYGVYQYVEQTADYSVLFEGALEMILEMCRFYVSYARLSDNKKHYDILHVYGLDHTHGLVNNEAYTNQVVKNALDSLIKCVAFAKQTDKNEVKNMFDEKGYEDVIKDVRELRRRLYTKKENIDYLVESYDGYFNLEDRKISKLKRIKFIHKSTNIDFEGVTFIKNANVLVMLAMFRDEFPSVVHRTCYEYYMRRSVQPDSFAQIMYLLEACESDLEEDAYDMFLELANLDVTNHILYQKGLNMALIGGMYVALVYGFAGVKHHIYLLSSDYKIPNKIRRIECNIRVADNMAYVKVKRNSATVKWSDFDDEEED